MRKVINVYEEAIPCPVDFNIAEFCKPVFGMYDGENATVEMICHNELMKVIVNRFGESAYTEVVDDGWFKIKTEVCVSPTFFGWCSNSQGE